MTRRVTVVACAAFAVALYLAGRAAVAAEESIGELRDRITEAEQKKLELVKTLALIYETRGEQDKAIACLREAFVLNPDDDALAQKLLDLLRQGQRWAEMVPIYERLIDEQPGRSQQYLLALGQCHFKLDQPERALEVLAQYRKENGDKAETYLSLGAVLSNNGHLAEAAALLEEGVAGAFKDNYRLRWQLGVVYARLEQTDKAIGAYEAALGLVGAGSDRSTINSQLIALYKKADRMDELIAKREKEIKGIDDQLVKLYWDTAQRQEQAGETAQAVEFYRKIVALAPESETGKQAAAKVAELSPKVEE
jgi:tetratricopeptide (TPR) repeat protein